MVRSWLVMFSYIKEGWKAAWKQPFIMLILFAYRLGWGIVLYGVVQSIVVPLLHRYPGIHAVGGQTELFLAEGQFQLLKTDFIHSYLWLFLSLLLARMIVTPLLNAGIYYSLSQTHLNSGYRFFKGIRELGLTFIFYYLLQMTLTLAPLYFLLPKWGQLVMNSDYKSTVSVLLPMIISYLIFGYFLSLGFMYLQFGKAWSRPFGESIRIALQSIVTIVGISLLFMLGSLLVTTIATSVLWIWAGFWTLLLYQVYRLIHTFFHLWVITTQQQLYSTKTNIS
jgi:hypothetical protein